MGTKYYAGIGSRKTPIETIKLIQKTATWLNKQSWTLRTGGCAGADHAFIVGALKHTKNSALKHTKNSPCEIYTPWKGYEGEVVKCAKHHGAKVISLDSAPFDEAWDSVWKYHPTANKLTPGAFAMHARNYLIVRYTKFVICWTPGGKETGGTGQGIRIAKDLGIPVFNLAIPEDRKRIEEKIK